MTVRPDRQLVLELGHTPAQGEADFLVGEGNSLAYERVKAFPDWSDPLTLLIGPAASGKSHLARIFMERAGARVISVDEVAQIARDGGTQPLVIEDVDRLGYDETDLFHLLNQSMRVHRPILLTARADIADWPLRTDDVRSRARRAAAFPLEITDDIQLSQMLVKLFADRQIAVDPKVISYVVARMERSAEEAMTVVDMMDKLALAKGSAITRAVASAVLEERSRANGESGNVQDWGAQDDE